MITEDYVSFETAKLLKEKGFDCPCKVWYAEYTSQFSGEKYNSLESDDYNIFNGDYKFLFYVPTLQMAMKWLREKYHLEIYPFHDAIQECNTWWYRVERHTKGCGLTEHESDSIYGKYEEACEAAIKYCLENLI